ncbi:MAG: DUF3168 domain-containing protein [Phycisphaerales bacterium]|nr:MAG: DUF3168 domain-containing protein [Phycisphaerales bacterium]
MTIEAELFQFLTTNAALSGLLADRLYPKQLPQNPIYPAIVYHRISGARDYSHDGSGNRAEPRFQFDCYDRTHVGAKALAEGLRLALSGYRGPMGTVDVQSAFLEDDDDGYDDDMKVYWYRMDFAIAHVE